MGTKTIETAKISEEMLAKINSLRDAGRAPVEIFTKEQDAIILEFYEKKNKIELSKLLGVCENTMRRRYKELISNG